MTSLGQRCILSRGGGEKNLQLKSQFTTNLHARERSLFTAGGGGGKIKCLSVLNTCVIYFGSVISATSIIQILSIYNSQYTAMILVICNFFSPEYVSSGNKCQLINI